MQNGYYCDNPDEQGVSFAYRIHVAEILYIARKLAIVARLAVYLSYFG